MRTDGLGKQLGAGFRLLLLAVTTAAATHIPSAVATRR
jgi:hypothetical protein